MEGLSGELSELHAMAVARGHKPGSPVNDTLFIAHLESTRPNPRIPYIRNVLKGLTHAPRQS